MLSTCLAELKCVEKDDLDVPREYNRISCSLYTDGYNKALAPVRDARQIAIAVYNPTRCNGGAAAAILN